jgi:hypothetical protein
VIDGLAPVFKLFWVQALINDDKAVVTISADFGCERSAVICVQSLKTTRA